MKRRLAILISGGGSNMVSLLDSLDADHPAEAVLVLSNRADAGGVDKAAARGVPTAVVDHRGFDAREAFESAVDAELRAAGADLICLAGFMRILTPAFVSGWDGRILNIHPSLLPKYPGLHTHARALEAGDAEHGCTVHEVTGELDAGPILGQAKLDVRKGDTPDTLAARVLPLEHRLYPAVLRRYAAGNRVPVALSAQD